MGRNDPFFGSWTWEIIAVVGSILCLVAQVSVLAAYDGKPILTWHGVTLNAIVSVLSTAGKASLLFAIEELVSQWKWILFTDNERPLMDFERIDSASRGPLGSIQLMWNCKKTTILRIGALIILLDAAVDPFSQQLVQNRQDLVYIADKDTIVTRATRYSKGSEYDLQVTTINTSAVNPNMTNVFADADFSMQSAVLYGLNQPLEKIMQQSTSKCSTGNCTWPAYESLAVCHRCTNLDDKLERFTSNGALYGLLETDNGALAVTKDGGTDFRLPNGLFIENLRGWVYNETLDGVADGGADGAVMMTAFGTGNAGQTVSMQDIDTLIWSMSMIRVTQDPTNASAAWPDLPHPAMECALFYCVNVYHTVVKDGVLQETATLVQDAQRSPDSWQMADPRFTGSLRTELLSSIEFSAYFSVLSRTDLTILSPGTNMHYNISQPAVDSISSYFQNTFASTLQKFDITDDGSTRGKLNGFYMTSGQVQYKPSTMQVLFSTEDLNKTFADLATSMSNALRDGADDGADGVATGEKGILTTFYKIQWPWITLHCAILVSGITFFGLTLYQNHSAPVWKSSSLAIMARGRLVQDVVQGTETVEQMEQKAKGARVMLNSVLKVNQLEYDPLETAYN